MLRRPSRSTRNYTLFPSTPLFRSLDDRRRAAGIAVEQGALRILRDIAQASGVGGIEKILADEADRLGNLLDRHRKPGRPAGVFAEVAITADDDRIALAFAGLLRRRQRGCEGRRRDDAARTKQAAHAALRPMVEFTDLSVLRHHNPLDQSSYGWPGRRFHADKTEQRQN